MTQTKLGRPFIYKDTFPEDLLTLMATGKKGAEVHAHFGISAKTFYEWVKRYPDFAEAYERGWEVCKRWWDDFGRQKMLEGDEKGFKYWKEFMAHNFGYGRNENAQTQININHLQINNNKSKDELIQYIQAELEELQVLEAQFELTEKIQTEDYEVLKQLSDEPPK